MAEPAVTLGGNGLLDVAMETVRGKDLADECLRVSTPSQRIWLAPLGGKIWMWEFAGKEVVHRAGHATSGVAKDLLWLPESARWKGDHLAAMRLARCDNDGKTVTVVYEGQLDQGLPGARIEKTFVIPADSPRVTVRVRHFNGRAEPAAISYYSHSIFGLPAGATGRRLYVCRSGACRGVPEMEGQSIWLNPAARPDDLQYMVSMAERKQYGERVFGEFFPGAGVGVIVTLPRDFLQIYRTASSSGADSTTEWMQTRREVPPGGSAETAFEMELCRASAAETFEGILLERSEAVLRDDPPVVYAKEAPLDAILAALPRVDLEAFHVADGRPELRGTVSLVLLNGRRLAAAQGGAGDCVLRVRVDPLCGTGPGRQAAFRVDPGMDDFTWPISIPLDRIGGGYFRLEATAESPDGEVRRFVLSPEQEEKGFRSLVTFAVKGERPAGAPPPPDGPRTPKETLLDAAMKLIAAQSMHAACDPLRALFITRPARTHPGTRSIGQNLPGQGWYTYWFPEEPLEFHSSLVDMEAWPFLHRLSALTGEPHFRALADGMLKEFAAHGFDERSGLGYFGTEARYDVALMRGSAGKTGGYMHFKPTDIGVYSEVGLDLLWNAAPGPMARMCKAAFYGLITDPVAMDYNRFCSYGFDDSARKHFMRPDAGHCAFGSAGAALVRLWASNFARTGDAESLDWAGRMLAKWESARHPRSGLAPYCFGSVSAGPLPMVPVDYAGVHDCVWSAVALTHAARELAGRGEGKPLARRCEDMALSLARGAARHGYDARRRVFHAFLELDGRPCERSVRYGFRTQEEKDQAVRRDPRMTQVPVHSGEGFYRNASAESHYVGTDIPRAVAFVASRTRDAELLDALRPWAETIATESAAFADAITKDGKWTFRASGSYIETLTLLFGATGEDRCLASAETLAREEMRRLARVEYPHWWRMSERSAFLDGLLALAEATARSATGRAG